MNWKQTLNPWGYARGLAEQLESEKVVCKAFADKLKTTGQLLNKERRLCDDAARDNVTLKAELAKALVALRIAEQRAGKKAGALRAHDAVKVFGCDVLVNDALPPGSFKIVGADTFQTNQPISFNERPVNTGTRRTKARRTATAPGGARLVLKNLEHDNRDSEKAYADAVKESEND